METEAIFKIEPDVDGERIAVHNLKQYYIKEVARVEEAIELAKKKMRDLTSTTIMTGAIASKIGELNMAISVGSMYLRKLKNKL